jgi:hypothetical protein
VYAMQHRNRTTRRRTDSLVASRQILETTCHSPAHAWPVIESLDPPTAMNAGWCATESKKPDAAHLLSEATMKSGDDYLGR